MTIAGVALVITLRKNGKDSAADVCSTRSLSNEKLFIAKIVTTTGTFDLENRPFIQTANYCLVKMSWFIF